MLDVCYVANKQNRFLVIDSNEHLGKELIFKRKLASIGLRLNVAQFLFHFLFEFKKPFYVHFLYRFFFKFIDFPVFWCWIENIAFPIPEYFLRIKIEKQINISIL